MFFLLLLPLLLIAALFVGQLHRTMSDKWSTAACDGDATRQSGQHASGFQVTKGRGNNIGRGSTGAAEPKQTCGSKERKKKGDINVELLGVGEWQLHRS
jgi:hypothetical protein